MRSTYWRKAVGLVLREGIGAVEVAWGADAPDYDQLVTLYGAVNPGFARYAPPKIVETVPTVIYGAPDPSRISTSYVERQNLTIRMACRASLG